MNPWWKLLAVGGLVAVGGSASAEWPKMKAKPQPLPGLPAYPYQPTPTATQLQPKPTLTGTSLPRLNVGTDADPLRAVPPTVLGTTTTTTETVAGRSVTTRRENERYDQSERVTTTTTTTTPGGTAPVLPGTAATFQLRDQVIRVDHCTLSEVSVTLYPDGKYVVGFRADQNPLASDPRTPALTTAARGLTADTGIEPGQFRRNKFYVTVRGYAADPLGEGRAGGSKAVVLDLPLDPFWVNRGESYRGLADGTSEAVRRNYTLVDRVEVDFTYR